MRDPARIDDIIERLRAVWKSSPDLRLSQLVVNGWFHGNVPGPLYSAEDAEMIEAIEQVNRKESTCPQ